MAGLLASLFGSAAPAANRAPSYSLQRLQQLYDRLSQFRESDLERQGGGEAVVETVRQITEALVWGEQNDTNFFDFFCEKSILADFIRVLSLQKAPKTVKVQLLQTLSMLMQNIRRQTSLYYLLSNNYVNQLIMMPLDFNDEEILAYYITLLKSLAMRLDGETIKFFFIQFPEPNFPLYIEATKFFMHRDQMVRATVRTITLQVYPIEFQPMRMYVLRHAAESYFTQLAYHLRDLWLRIDAAALGAGEDDLATLQHESDLQQDLLIYLSDVFELEVAELNEVLADRLLNGVMLPVLLSSVASAGSADRPEARLPPASTTRPAFLSSGRGGSAMPSNAPTPSRVLSPTVALFLLRQVFDTLRCRVLLEPLAAALLQPAVPAALACALPQVADEAALAESSLRGDLVPNSLRGHFVGFLRSQEDAPFLLAAAVVHSCVRNRQALSLAFLESASVLPPRAGGERGRRQAGAEPSEASAEAECDERWQPSVSEPFEVLLLLLQGLQRHAFWMPDTFQVLVRIVLDVLLDPAACHHAECYAAALRAVQAAVRSAAQRLLALLQEVLAAGGGDGDELLDALLAEWELHRLPLATVGEACGNARRLLLPSAAAGTRSCVRPQAPPAVGAKRAVRALLLLRRLAADLQRFAPQVPRERPAGQPQNCFWAGPSNEPSPLQLDAKTLGTYCEGMSFEIGGMARIVCGVSARDAKHTRYFMLSDYWLLLVQPDLSTPGWAVVTTLWPLQQVQSMIDRGDPRTLRIGMQAFRGGPAPGESVGSAPLGMAQSACFTLTLNFEDVKRCHHADRHLQLRRREVRQQLLRRAAAFVEQSCAQASPT